MSQHPDHQQFDEETADKVDLSNVIPIRADVAQDQQPAPVKKAKGHKKHPPAKPRPPYTGKRVQDSHYYIAPTDRLDLGLAITLDRKLTPSARDVFVLIMAHYNNRKGYAFPSRGRMAELLELTETAISAAIKLLVERGWLLVEQTRADGHKGVNHYFPQLDKVDEILTATGFKVVKTGPSDASKVRSDDEQGPVSQGNKVRSDAVSRSGKPDINPGIEPSKKNPEREPGAPKGVVSPSEMDDWFNLFWKHSPRKEDKPAARREFERVITENGRDAFEQMMDNLCAYAEHVGDEYLYKPANWLGKGQWRVTRTAPKPTAPKRRAPGGSDYYNGPTRRPAI